MWAKFPPAGQGRKLPFLPRRLRKTKSRAGALGGQRHTRRIHIRKMRTCKQHPASIILRKSLVNSHKIAYNVFVAQYCCCVWWARHLRRLWGGAAPHSCRIFVFLHSLYHEIICRTIGSNEKNAPALTVSGENDTISIQRALPADG